MKLSSAGRRHYVYRRRRAIDLNPGEALFIPRRVIHGFTTGGDVDARFLAVISPGLLGSGYFRDVADVLAGEGPPDVEMLGEVMRRHGLTPAPPA
jgi:hypothetical protein